MSLTIPAATNYQSPLVSFPTRWQRDPVEGSRAIPCEIDWVTMGGTAKCCYVNIQNNAVNNFSQIAALKVDNSKCGSDVVFIFDDTNDTITIPAYSPTIIVPVITNQTQFYVSGADSSLGDVTRFQILNSVPPPIAVPVSSAQEFSNTGWASLETASTTIVAAGVNGTIDSCAINLSWVKCARDWIYEIIIRDGDYATNGNNYIQTVAGGPSGGSGNQMVFNSEAMGLRFTNGLNLILFGTSPQCPAIGPLGGGTIAAQINYRIP